jgi:hypothetical protein
MSNNPLEFFRKNRSDLSNFVIHLTKNGSFETWKEMTYYSGHFLFKDSEILKAEDSLRGILAGTSPIILARSPFSIFKMIGINTGKTVKKNIHPDALKAVCFSETPLRELSSFYKATQDPKNWTLKTNKYQKFGLAFSADLVRSRGGHPVFYYDRRNSTIRDSVEKIAEDTFIAATKDLLFLYEPFGPKILEPSKELDFRWEREWRVRGDFKFSFDDVAFGICPESKIQEFEKLIHNKFPFIDPDVEIDKLKQDLENRGWKDLADKI